ncbi:MAG: hypothetical protein GY841_13460 [FCB group bacterium]|nr:hypothetical protein [FCB group bacterium]
MKRIITFIAGLGLLSGAVAAQVNIGNMQMDWIAWGMRQLIVPFDNQGADTAQIRLTIATLYSDHYLSGLDLYEEDTVLFLPPHQKQTVILDFELPGSYGRGVSKAYAYWYYPQTSTAELKADSVGQSFSSVFHSSQDASLFAERRHNPGPAFAQIDYPMLNFEFPRLLLYMLSRQMPVSKIEKVLIVDKEYIESVRERLTDQGLFPFPDNIIDPGVLGISEMEGFKLKPEIRNTAAKFAKWFDNKGRKNLAKILDKAGLDPTLTDIPALQLEILLALLREQWITAEQGFDISHYDQATEDIIQHNQPRWVVQGGAYFMPKLSLAAYEHDNGMYLATLSPNPKLRIERMVMEEMMAAVDSAAGTIPEVTTGQIKDIIKRAKKKKLIKEINVDLLALIENAKAEIGFIKPYQYPYLADYICRVVLGEYFIGHPPADGRLDCVSVRYEK